MLEFDFNALEELKMRLDGDEISVETAEGAQSYPCEKWREAYGAFFVAAGNELTRRDDWSFINDFTEVRDEELPKAKSAHAQEDCEAPELKISERSSVSMLSDFEKLKKAAYNRIRSGKSQKDLDGYTAIYDEIAYCAMCRVWDLFAKKLITVEEARNETAAVFREYRKYRLLLRDLESYEKSVFKTYQAQQELLKRSAHLFSHVIKNAEAMSDEMLIDELIDIISAQNGENVSGDVLKEKITERRRKESETIAKLYAYENDECENEPTDGSDSPGTDGRGRTDMAV